MEVNGFGALGKSINQYEPGESGNGTNSGARQNKKNEGDRLQLVVERNENPNYFLQERFIKS